MLRRVRRRRRLPCLSSSLLLSRLPFFFAVGAVSVAGACVSGVTVITSSALELRLSRRLSMLSRLFVRRDLRGRRLPDSLLLPRSFLERVFFFSGACFVATLVSGSLDSPAKRVVIEAMILLNNPVAGATLGAAVLVAALGDAAGVAGAEVDSAGAGALGMTPDIAAFSRLTGCVSFTSSGSGVFSGLSR